MINGSGPSIVDFFTSKFSCWDYLQLSIPYYLLVVAVALFVIKIDYNCLWVTL